MNRLYKLERTGMKYSLDNIRRLMAGLEDPHGELKFIHIAGTNGKGGVASFMASIFMEGGFKTGLFTSPHILKFNERIRINGRTIPNKYILDFVQRNKKLIEKIKPSFFEVNTALAFKYFADNKVDIAVVEAGLGGRLDSTNIITPLVSVITEIGIDHVDYLGKTLEKIASEKAGIIKSGVPTIVSDTHKGLRPIFRKQQTNTNVISLDDVTGYRIINSGLSGSTFVITGTKDKFRVPLAGDYQVRNAVTAIAASEIFFKSFGHRHNLITAFKKGLMNIKENSGYRCRLEYFKHEGKHWLLDISHNPDGIRAAIQSAKKFLKGFRKRFVIFGMMKDKDYETSLKILADFADCLILTKPNYERALAPETLYTHVDRRVCAEIRENAREAVKKAQEIAGSEDVILVIGSFFLVSDVIKATGIGL